MMFSEKVVSQYRELKREAGEGLLLMQVGVFMQVMNEDARTVSKVTGLKLKMTGEVDAPVVVGGFPKSGLDIYVGKLVRAGCSVVIALQDGEKKRNITEVIKLSRTNDASVVSEQKEGGMAESGTV